MGIFNTEKDRYRNENLGYRRPGMFGGFGFFPPVIKALLVSNVLIFIFQFLFLNNLKVGNFPMGEWFLRTFALMPIGQGFLPWQLFTYQFMHGGFMHIFFNMLALWMFGMEIERIWGSKKFAIYYLTCGVGAGLANLFIAPLFAPAMPTIGASGAVYGVLVAFAMMFPNRPIYLYFLFPIRAKFFIMIYIAIEFLSIGGMSNIAHAAHLGGALTGFIYMLLSNSGIKFNNPFKGDDTYTGTKSNMTYHRNPYYDKYNTDKDISDAEFYEEKKDNASQERVDEILDKISKTGYKSLTDEEKRILFDASKKL